MPEFLRGLAVMAGLFALVVIALPVALLALLFLWVWGNHLLSIVYNNARYAEEVFSPCFETFTTLESKRSHEPFNLDWQCTYAVIALLETMQPKPLACRQLGQHSQSIWGGQGNWVLTPMTALPSGKRDTVSTCAREWADITRKKVSRALSEEGSFVIIGPVGETVYLYSKPQRIAARIRYGD